MLNYFSIIFGPNCCPKLECQAVIESGANTASSTIQELSTLIQDHPATLDLQGRVHAYSRLLGGLWCFLFFPLGYQRGHASSLLGQPHETRDLRDLWIRQLAENNKSQTTLCWLLAWPPQRDLVP